MTWATARAQIATVLAAVSVSSPITQTMERVYTAYPKERIQEFPSVVLRGWSLDIEDHSMHQQQFYRETCLLMLKENDRAQLVDLAVAWQAAINTAFVAAKKLGGNADVAGPLTWGTWTPGEIDDDADGAEVEFSIPVLIDVAVTFAP